MKRSHAFLLALGLVASCVVWAGCRPKRFWVYGVRPIRWQACEARFSRAPSVRNPSRSGLSIRRRFLEPVDRMLGLEGATEALNVNAMDMVPDSGWFVNRLGLGSAVAFYTGQSRTAVPGGEMTAFDVARGAAVTAGPSALGKWVVTGAGRDRKGAYLLIRDLRHNFFLFRFDARGWSGLATGAELVTTLLLHAAGYRVPERHMVFFHRERLDVSESARFRTGTAPLVIEAAEKGDGWGGRLTGAAVERLLRVLPRMSDGSIRATATRLQDGKALGPYPLYGRRTDDPNDRADHQHLRELRGFRLLAAWLNLAGLDEHSSMDLFHKGRVLHLLVRFRSSMGSTGSGRPKGLAESLGGVVFPVPWMRRLAGMGRELVREHPALGFFTSAGFRPDLWRVARPHPAFVRTTARDLFWAGRIMAAVTKDMIRSAVDAAMLDRRAGSRMVDVLWARVRRAARYGLSRSGPFGFFGVEPLAGGRPALCATDLWRHAGFDGTRGVTYQSVVAPAGGRPRFYPVVRPRTSRFCVPLNAATRAGGAGLRYLVVSLSRLERPSRPVVVHVRRGGSTRGLTVVGVER